MTPTPQDLADVQREVEQLRREVAQSRRQLANIPTSWGQGGGALPAGGKKYQCLQILDDSSTAGWEWVRFSKTTA